MQGLSLCPWLTKKHKEDVVKEKLSMVAKPLPISVNPTASQKLMRCVGRLTTLYAAINKGTYAVSEVSGEILRYRTEVANCGHQPPEDEDEARTFLAKLKQPEESEN